MFDVISKALDPLTCWLMFVGALDIAVAPNNPWNKGRMFGLSCDKLLMIILMHGGHSDLKIFTSLESRSLAHCNSLSILRNITIPYLTL